MSLPGAHLAAAEIVQRMMTENQQRAARLEHYTAEREYHLKYTGFPHSLEASMDVQVTCDTAGTKSFRIVQESGSKLLRERVLRKLLESEEEALKDPERTALTTANYNFDLVETESGTEGSAAAPTYVFTVDPKHDSKFLYRGKIWVDGADFAVKRVQAEPAKNPSFWISKTSIAHTYTKIGQFWLPHHNQTETKVRFGGVAALTIDYTGFQLDPHGL
jgi:hypothetical protein